MRNNSVRAIARAATLPLAALTACTTTDLFVTQTTAAGTGSPAASSPASQDWFDQTLYDTQNQQRSSTFEGDPEQPHLQYIAGAMTDTSKFAAQGAQKVCFANASISNPWRQTGWITMNQQLEGTPDSRGSFPKWKTGMPRTTTTPKSRTSTTSSPRATAGAFVISPTSTRPDPNRRTCLPDRQARGGV